jgi:hypothetical protein
MQEGSISTRLERITPKKAAIYLANAAPNRPVRKAWVAQLAQMMRDGDFHVTHQGIAFNDKGELVDARHRLLAVIESGCYVTMNVTRGLSDSAMNVIDTGKPRSVVDAMAIDGHDINGRDVAIGKRMSDGLDHTGHAVLTRPDLIRFVAKHIDAIQFSRQSANERWFRHASIRAPIARAWYTKNRARLEEFSECLNSGIMKSEADKAAILLRNFVMKTNLAGHEASNILYRKTERALQNFLDRKVPDVLTAANEELFPLPEEKPDVPPSKRTVPGAEASDRQPKRPS